MKRALNLKVKRNRHIQTSALLFCIAVFPSIFSMGCMSGAVMEARSSEIQEIVDRIYPRAYNCSPKLLATAEANVEFSRFEMKKGNLVQARRHLDIAEKSAKAADAMSSDEACTTSVGGPNPKVDIVAPVNVGEVKLVPTPEDRDGDTILDKVDKCPDQPEDFDGYQDSDGCPDLDNDDDGVPDKTDKCPNIAEDRDGYQDDDGCPEFDNDGDGIDDSIDKCPNEPEDYDGYQDLDGCPDPDNDGDGVIDLNDLCPDQPENYNGNKDNDGCPDKDLLAKIEGDTIKLNQKVFFKTGKSIILEQSFPLLNDVADLLAENPTIRIRIEGHTDSRGNARRNKKLSDDRAAAVRTYLMEHGIAGDRMESVGFGKERPIDDNRTKEGRANNRRVEIHITSK